MSLIVWHGDLPWSFDFPSTAKVISSSFHQSPDHKEGWSKKKAKTTHFSMKPSSIWLFSLSLALLLILSLLLSQFFRLWGWSLCLRNLHTSQPVSTVHVYASMHISLIKFFLIPPRSSLSSSFDKLPCKSQLFLKTGSMSRPRFQSLQAWASITVCCFSSASSVWLIAFRINPICKA